MGVRHGVTFYQSGAKHDFVIEFPLLDRILYRVTVVDRVTQEVVDRIEQPIPVAAFLMYGRFFPQALEKMANWYRTRATTVTDA